jgi:16S rRNA (guanine527-N7)-methyltransferase
MNAEPRRLERLDRLADLIAASPHNLVARGQRERVRTHHIAEAEALAEALPLRAGQRWVDVGSGGGLPGLVLAVCRPDTHWLLVEARQKKAAAVLDFARTLGLANVTVAAEPAETVARQAEHRGRYDGVTSRAVGRLDVVAELSRGFLRPGGVIVAIKGPGWEAEREAAEAARETLAVGPIAAHQAPSPTRQTWLVTMVANGEVPPVVPRRPGVPRRRPLGGPQEEEQGGDS